MKLIVHTPTEKFESETTEFDTDQFEELCAVVDEICKTEKSFGFTTAYGYVSLPAGLISRCIFEVQR